MTSSWAERPFVTGARSLVELALTEGASAAEIRHVAVLAVTTAGFPTTIAALAQVLKGSRESGSSTQSAADGVSRSRQ